MSNPLLIATKTYRVAFILAFLSATSSLIAQAPVKEGTQKELSNPQNTSERLREIVLHLSQTIGERNLTKPKRLSETADYIQKSLET